MKLMLTVKSIKKGKEKTFYFQEKKVTVDELIAMVDEKKIKSIWMETYENEKLILSGFINTKKTKNLKNKITRFALGKI